MSTFPIVAKLGGRDAVVTALPELDFPVTRDQVRMWEARRRIPGDAQIALMRLAERRRLGFSSSDFEYATRKRHAARERRAS